MNGKTILPPDVRGVMTISGYRGTGKTTLASQADLAENIIFFDFENKGEGIHNQLNFGKYIPVTQIAGGVGDILKVIRREIANIKQNEFAVAIFDNISPLETALYAEAQSNAQKYAKEYGLSATNIIKNMFGAAKGVVNGLIGDMIASRLHEKGVRLIIVTSHIKPVFNVDNKFSIKGASRWQELSILTLVLINGENSPIPSALVVKEQLASIASASGSDLGKMMRGEIPSHEIKRRLPYRLPTATWQSIRKYLYNPADLNNPAKGEVPTLEEADPFSNKLNKEQIAIKLLLLQNMEELKKQELEAEKELEVNNSLAIATYAKELKTQNMVLPVIVKTIKEAIEKGDIEYTGDVTIGKVASWIK